MAKVGAQRAAVLTGRSKSTIQRAMNCGKLSYEIDQNDRRVIDVSELERVFGIKQTSLQAPLAATTTSDASTPIKTVEQAVEKEHMSMRIKMLEQQLVSANDYIDDLKDQRDKWEKQASQVLITSQYSQRQAEELREQIRKREERARMRRQQIEGGFRGSTSSESPSYSFKSPQTDTVDKQESFTSIAPEQKKKEVRRLEEQMQKLKAQNENENENDRPETDEDNSQSVFRFWKRVKG